MNERKRQNNWWETNEKTQVNYQKPSFKDLWNVHILTRNYRFNTRNQFWAHSNGTSHISFSNFYAKHRNLSCYFSKDHNNISKQILEIYEQLVNISVEWHMVTSTEYLIKLESLPSSHSEINYYFDHYSKSRRTLFTKIILLFGRRAQNLINRCKSHDSVVFHKQTLVRFISLFISVNIFWFWQATKMWSQLSNETHFTSWKITLN